MRALDIALMDKDIFHGKFDKGKHEIPRNIGPIIRVVRSSWLPVKIAAYLICIGRLLCLAFLYRWHFLHKISLEWPLTLTTQPSTSKLSDNPRLFK